MDAGHFPKFTLNFTLYGTLFIMPNGKFAPGKFWKGKKRGCGAQLSARRSLLLSVCSMCSENSGSVDRVNNMLSFSVKVLPPWHCTLCTQARALPN